MSDLSARRLRSPSRYRGGGPWGNHGFPQEASAPEARDAP
jgi:hypothetical protein